MFWSGDAGTYSDAPKAASAINRIGQFWKPWFYKYLETIQSTGSCTEYIPLRDYYHRHTSGMFWEMEEIIPFGNHPVFRFACGWLMPPKASLLKLTQGKTIKRLYEEKHVIQDMFMPVDTLSEILEVFEEQFKVYPLWLCPFKLPQNPGLVHPKQDKTMMYVDVGAYSVPKVENFQAKKALKCVEHFVCKKDGFQMLYADNTLTREEFGEMFDRELYDNVRERYGCVNAFPDVYDKVGRHA
ncbi:Delta(24)-sterol reductase-like [Oopsacas minuta]|uniref:Delta(24)-sterol reductase-like n=1 Tax=Oopsacas minuta TaxID=111878 RepID=A0AAV7KF09_9METZ|nr:Delta(24)-sterol reductase-like [Oopsacas minuta]